MPTKRILAIEIPLPLADVDEESFDSDVSLLDWDIVLFRPDISAFVTGTNTYQAKPSLSEWSSFRLRERAQHWRRELLEAVNAGKTVFVFLSELQEVFIDTGERQYSGTGRNRQTTQIVTPYSNYNAIPASLGVVRARGERMRLASSAEVLRPYWSAFEGRSEYQVRLTESVKYPLVLTRDGSSVVGCVFAGEASAGSLVCLPDLTFGSPDIWTQDLRTREGGKWTEEAARFAGQLRSEILSIDRALRADFESTPTPAWVHSRTLDLPGEAKIKTDLLRAEASIEKLEKRKQALRRKLADEQRLKALLYEKGKPLERAIVSALKILGFRAAPYEDSESEFDVVFEAKEGRLLGEAEGKDKKAINIDKLRQLEMNIHEDFARDEVSAMAKGVLFGNAFRLAPLEERHGYFTEKVHSAALRSGHALVCTPDLYRVVQFLLCKRNTSFAAACRAAIFSADGSEVAFPDVPEALEATTEDQRKA